MEPTPVFFFFFNIYYFYFFFILNCFILSTGHTACGILAPQLGIEPMLPPLGAQSLNHWTTRESPLLFLLIWLHWVLVAASESSMFIAACRIFRCGMWTLSCSIWDLVFPPGIEPGPPVLGVQSLSPWTAREVPSSILAWEIPWREEPGGLWSMGSKRVGHNWACETHTKFVWSFLRSLSWRIEWFKFLTWASGWLDSPIASISSFPSSLYLTWQSWWEG